MKTFHLHPGDSINERLRQIPTDNQEEIHIRLSRGVYREKVVIDRPHLHFFGEDAQKTVITYDDYANAPMPDGSKRGTFRSYTVLLDASFVTMENLTIENTAAPRKKVGQAIALYADGDRLHFKNCRLLGNQDTLFTGPLPPAPKQAGGFTGPKEFAPRQNGRQFYENCYICGDIDFIFGSATAYFLNCHIEAKNNLPPEELESPENRPPVCSYLTAASTPEGQRFGYVFDRCRITAKDCPPGSVYLGRPWRIWAKTVFLNCSMDESIHPAGFHDWNKPESHETVFYGEYGCTGPGSAQKGRAPFARRLTAGEAASITPETVFERLD